MPVSKTRKTKKKKPIQQRKKTPRPTWNDVTQLVLDTDKVIRDISGMALEIKAECPDALPENFNQFCLDLKGVKDDLKAVADTIPVAREQKPVKEAEMTVYLDRFHTVTQISDRIQNTILPVFAELSGKVIDEDLAPQTTDNELKEHEA